MEFQDLRKEAPMPVQQNQKRRKIKRFMKGIMYVSLVVTFLIITALTSAYFYTGLSLPQLEGVVAVEGLEQEVLIYRDESGVPHIIAQTEPDLYMAQGYVTAQDRLFQMEMMKRVASGRMAEITMQGNSVTSDKFFRTLQLRRYSEKSLDLLSDETIEILEAYSAGVNLYIEEATSSFGKLPVEYTTMGFKPEEWTAVDTLLIGKYIAHMQSGNYREESYRQHLVNQVGEERASELFPTYPEDGYITLRTTGQWGAQHNNSRDLNRQITPVQSQDVLNADLKGLLQDFSPFYTQDYLLGSNAWVLSGEYTQSGKPMLANDPHLQVSTPSIWYQNHLILEGEQKHNNIGVSFPGVPGVVIGHNDYFAWGITNSQADIQDLVFEKRNPDDPLQFKYNGEWKEASVIEELIKIKGQEDIEYEVINTEHGPLMTDFIGDDDHPSETDLALKWTALQPSKDIEAVLHINRAQNYEEFRESLRYIEAPAMNYVYAGVDGTIAFHTTGLIPIRKKGDGSLPVEGWSGEYGWDGFIPFEELPHDVNPEEGLIITANNKIIDDRYPYTITTSWAPPYRAQRIADVLNSIKGEVVMEDMISLQKDVRNLQAEKLLPILLPLIDQDMLTEEEQQAYDLLQAWDASEEAERAEPLIYHMWLEELNRTAFAEQMSPFIYARMADKGNVISNMISEAGQGQENTWLTESGGLYVIANQSFVSAVQTVIQMYGNHISDWRWGDFHQFGPRHVVFQYHPIIKHFVNPTRYPVGGSDVTVAMNAFHSVNGEVSFAAPWKHVVDLGDLRNSKAVSAPGQSGHFRSEWYEDQLELYVQGQMLNQKFDQEGFKSGKKLILTPTEVE